MGIIKAAADAVRGAFADQWLEVIEPGNMGDQTVFSAGVPTRRGQNTKGTPGVVSNGSRCAGERDLIQRGHLISCQTVPSSMCIPTSS